MAKHDQRILKFLNQNTDRAPTITEMMTRLNISISDISDSLQSLQAQGAISKKTNHQGIECWFPTSSPAAQPIPAAAMSSGQQISSSMLPQGTQQMATQMMPQMAPQMAAVGNPMVSDSRAGGEVRSGLDSRFLASAMPERNMAAPEPQPPMPKAAPVQVQHIGMVEPVYPGAGVDSSARNPIPAIPPQPAPMGVGMYGLEPASRGVGILTLIVGLIASVALSGYLTTRITAKEIKKASTTFVDRKSLTDATAAFADFQEKTKTHVTALEAQVKQLTDELAASKATAESLKTAAVAAPAKPEAAKPAEPKGKTAKAVKKDKPAVAAKPKASGMSAIAKAAARGAAMRKKAKASSTSDFPSDAGSESPSASESSPSVPEPPGLEELPPPPSE